MVEIRYKKGMSFGCEVYNPSNEYEDNVGEDGVS
jgi:hypothetical protein